MSPDLKKETFKQLIYGVITIICSLIIFSFTFETQIKQETKKASETEIKRLWEEKTSYEYVDKQIDQVRKEQTEKLNIVIDNQQEMNQMLREFIQNQRRY